MIDPLWMAFIMFGCSLFGAFSGMCFYLVWLHKNDFLK